MSYQVLARKWRPKNFQQLMGQEHVVSVLANALSQNRLHHAYLFTGTRGVGKTTIARIFAKSLNCEQGITDKPCGQCNACIDIDQGCFVDLLEIDAASKTKVDDTREILDNVQYAPSRGRYKVYLIDEVHMLSRHSFNALLKTLEEPPEHVKFILATTDPQKLPITVLSRCLQFHLKALTVSQIEQKLTEILEQENVNHDAGCLTLLAKAARGSMRDSLSLTDQAIAQGHGNINLVNIQQMLGGIDQKWAYQLVIALLKHDSHSLMMLSQKIASYAPSYSQLFAELIQLFHQVALLQLVDKSFDLPTDLLQLLKKFSQAMSPEDVQLYYQICLNGRKDLPYASDEQAAFDMTLLRLFAFKPMQKPHANNPVSINENQQLSAVNFDDLNLEESSTESVNKTVRQVENIPSNNDGVGGLENSARVGDTEQVSRKTIEDTTTSTGSIEKLPMPNAIVEHHVTEQNSIEQSDLAQQMQAIERQAQDLHQGNTSGEVQEEQSKVESLDSIIVSEHEPKTPINESLVTSGTVEPALENSSEGAQQLEQQSVQQTTPLNIDSPVSSVLATRNMLRSRKKALENDVKKSNDATMRQSTSQEATQAEKIKNIPIEKVISIPEPEVPFHQDRIDPATVTKANQVDKWAHMIDSMQLTARIRQLAIHATISEDSTDDNLILLLNQSTRHLKTDVAHQQLQQTLCDFLARNITVTLEVVEETVADPYQIQTQINDKRLDYAKALIKEDPMVKALESSFQATLDEESIYPR